MQRPQNGLTTTLIRSLKLAPKGIKYDVGDVGETRRLRIRVSSVSKTFYMSARWRKGKNSATLRAIGRFAYAHTPGCFTLAEAREEVRVLDRKRLSQMGRRRLNAGATFADLAEKYLGNENFLKLRRRKQCEREIRRELLDEERNPWRSKAVTQVDDSDIADLVRAIRERPAPSQAINILGHVRSIFNFGIMPENRKEIGLTSHPIAHLTMDRFGLEKTKRQVILDDQQLAIFWVATESLGYPFGPFFQLICLGGQRNSNWRRARRSQIDLAKRDLVVPYDEFKTGVHHIVRLSDQMINVLSKLPSFSDPAWEDYLFSFSSGRTPMNCSGKAKLMLDDVMLAELKKLAVIKGADPDAVVLKRFVTHDFRRVVRTKLAALGVNDAVAEAVIGHGKTGIVATYNLHDYYHEKLAALQAWADELDRIVKEYRRDYA